MSELELVFKEAVKQAGRANELLKLCLEAQDFIRAELEQTNYGVQRLRKQIWLNRFAEFVLKTKQELEDDAE
jgi:hypothetical protein